MQSEIEQAPPKTTLEDLGVSAFSEQAMTPTSKQDEVSQEVRQRAHWTLAGSKILTDDFLERSNSKELAELAWQIGEAGDLKQARSLLSMAVKNIRWKATTAQSDTFPIAATLIKAGDTTAALSLTDKAHQCTGGKVASLVKARLDVVNLVLKDPAAQSDPPAGVSEVLEICVNNSEDVTDPDRQLSLYSEAAVSYAQIGNVEKAEEAIKLATGSSIDSSELRMSVARILVSKGDQVDKALSLLKGLDRTQSNLLLELVDICADKGDIAGVNQILNAVRELNPRFLKTTIWRTAQSLATELKCEAASEFLDTCSNPSERQVFLKFFVTKLAQVVESLDPGQERLASQIDSLIFKIEDPNRQARAFMELADSFAKSGSSQSEISYHAAASVAESAGIKVEALCKLASCYVKRGSHQMAESCLDRALTQAGSDSLLRTRVALQKLKFGKT